MVRELIDLLRRHLKFRPQFGNHRPGVNVMDYLIRQRQ